MSIWSADHKASSLCVCVFVSEWISNILTRIFGAVEFFPLFWGHVFNDMHESFACRSLEQWMGRSYWSLATGQRCDPVNARHFEEVNAHVHTHTHKYRCTQTKMNSSEFPLAGGEERWGCFTCPEGPSSLSHPIAFLLSTFFFKKNSVSGPSDFGSKLNYNFVHLWNLWSCIWTETDSNNYKNKHWFAALIQMFPFFTFTHLIKFLNWFFWGHRTYC